MSWLSRKNRREQIGLMMSKAELLTPPPPPRKPDTDFYINDLGQRVEIIIDASNRMVGFAPFGIQGPNGRTKKSL